MSTGQAVWRPMKSTQSDIDAKYRSLLQKAVRRGNEELVYITSAIVATLASRDKNWFRTRAAIITFEDCWPLGAELVFNRKFYSKVAVLVKAARSIKAKDATGLGYLAYALAGNDHTVLDGSADDRHIKIVAQGVQRPDDFWQWVERQKKSRDADALIENAFQFRNAGRPRDRATILAAAYLAVASDIPLYYPSESTDQQFPYWVVFDKHTPQGQRVFRDIARDLYIPLHQLEWTSFYFEGAATNASIYSPWWGRFCRWRFNKINLPPEEAHLLWEPVEPQIKAALADDQHRLHKELYEWKMGHMNQVEKLKKQVALFIEHGSEISSDQMEMF